MSFLAITLLACKPTTPNPVARKIKQSVKLHEDNVNGAQLRINNIRIREVTNFFYNAEGLLDSFNIFSDSSQTILMRSLKLTYLPNNKIRGIFFDDSATPKYVAGDFYYNTNRQLMKLADTMNLDLYGLFFTYNNNKITNVNVQPGNGNIANLLYDSNDNLVQYTTTDVAGNPIKVRFNFDYTKSIPNNLDLKFGSAGVRFMYAGGVNVISLMGLNLGAGNTNWVIQQTESLISTGQVTNTFQCDYSPNSNQEIINRTVTLNDTISVYYEYKY
ncbi:MAG: hypothetical protein U0T69_08655 [Chitinophagales bacterium]